MKVLSVFLLCFMMCPAGRVHLVQSTSQEWIGGLRESGYGTDYQLTIKVHAGSDQLAFDELWTAGRHMKVRLAPGPSGQRQTGFSRGSRVVLKAGYTIRPGDNEKSRLTGADLSPAPFNFKGAGLLGYTYKGKKRYLEIARFTILEKIIYP